MDEDKDTRTLGDMFADLSRETRTLVQQEIQLAKAELGEKARSLGKSAGFLVAGAFLAYAGLLAVLAAVVLGLIALGLPPWGGALLGGVLIAVAGYLLVHAGLAGLRAQPLTPQQTLDSLKEDAQWLRAQTK